MRNPPTPPHLQVEKRSEPRKDLPPPAAGQLPLPAPPAGAAPGGLPGGVGQLLSAPLPAFQELPWPAGAVPAAPAPHAKAVLDFKAGRSWLAAAGLGAPAVPAAQPVALLC